MILITGASGILGSALMRRLGKRARGVSRSGRGGAETADLSRAADVARLFADEPVLVVNAAAFSDVDGCERDAAQAWASNAESVKNLAVECSRRGVPFLHVSTNYVFDGRKERPYAEDDAASPVQIYGLTKLAGEHYALACSAPTAVVRTSWLFGEGNSKNFVAAIGEQLKREPVVRVLDDQVDAPTHVEDLTDALERVAAALEAARSGARRYREIFQVCNAGTGTRLEMARVMKESSGSPARVERLDASELKGRVAIRPAYGAMSPAKYEAAFGVRMRDWREALAEFVRSAPCAS